MLRPLAAILLSTAFAFSAAAAVETGDVFVGWYAWSRYGVNVVDPVGNLKPDVVQFPRDPVPDQSKFPSGVWIARTIPMRSGERLILSRLTPSPLVAKYDASGENVVIYSLPSETGVASATSIELFSDQCTLVWTIAAVWNAGDTLTSARRHAVRRFDICANKSAGDLQLVPEPAEIPSFVRQLSNGDLLVVTSSEILRYTASGKLVASFSNPLQKVIVDLQLTPDGKGFWVSDDLRLLRYDLANTREPVVNVQPIRWNVESQEPPMTQALSVVGEWRASLQPSPRRRAVTH